MTLAHIMNNAKFNGTAVEIYTYLKYKERVFVLLVDRCPITRFPSDTVLDILIQQYASYLEVRHIQVDFKGNKVLIAITPVSYKTALAHYKRDRKGANA